jgi:hypothetical protein
MDATGSILLDLVDGTRHALPGLVQWSARIFEGRSPTEWQATDVEGTGSVEHIKGLRHSYNLFDNYAAIVSANRYKGAAWKPVYVSPAKTAGRDAEFCQEGHRKERLFGTELTVGIHVLINFLPKGMDRSGRRGLLAKNHD